jgi:hypothetical protein
MKKNWLPLLIIISGYLIVFGTNFTEFLLSFGFFMMAIGFSFILDSNNKEDIDDIKSSLKRIEDSLKPISESAEIPPK